jgi:arginase
MALGHMLALEGTEPTLAAAADGAPLLEPEQVLLLAQNPRHATRFERGEIERLALAQVALEEVRGDPEGAARQAPLTVLATDPRLVAITVTELNPHNAEADDGLLERFAASFADAIGA